MILSIASSSFGKNPVEDTLASVVQTGFPAVELTCVCNGEETPIDPRQTFTDAGDELSARLRQHGLKVTAVFAGRLPADDPAAAAEFTERAVELAIRIGAPAVVTAYTAGDGSARADADALWSTLREVCLRACQYAAEANISTVLSADPSGPMPDLKSAQRLYQDVKSPGMGLEVVLPISSAELEPGTTLRQACQSMRGSLSSVRLNWTPDAEKRPMADDAQSPDLRQTLRILHEISYAGPISIVLPGDAPEPEQAAATCHEALSELMGSFLE